MGLTLSGTRKQTSLGNAGAEGKEGRGVRNPFPSCSSCLNGCCYDRWAVITISPLTFVYRDDFGGGRNFVKKDGGREKGRERAAVITISVSSSSYSISYCVQQDGDKTKICWLETDC